MVQASSLRNAASGLGTEDYVVGTHVLITPRVIKESEVR